ncbi:DUF2069 domain-containing protein [Luteimonas sp. A478]
MTPRTLRIVHAATLIALAGLFALWYLGRGHMATALVVFIGPPLLLGVGVLAGSRLATFWSGVAGLLWFSHGVMEAWSTPGYRLLAIIEILLAVAIILLASWPGLAARQRKRSG